MDLIRQTRSRVLNIETYIRFKLKEHIRSGPLTGPYGVSMQFEQVRAMLTGRFGPTSVHQANRILQLAFPDISKKRMTILMGLRPRSNPSETPSVEAGQTTAPDLGDGRLLAH